MPTPLNAPSEDPGPHLSYAIQWILFAIMGFVFIGYVIRTERRHRREDAEDPVTATMLRHGCAPPRGGATATCRTRTRSWTPPAAEASPAHASEIRSW